MSDCIMPGDIVVDRSAEKWEPFTVKLGLVISIDPMQPTAAFGLRSREALVWYSGSGPSSDGVRFLRRVHR